MFWQEICMKNNSWRQLSCAAKGHILWHASGPDPIEAFESRQKKACHWVQTNWNKSHHIRILCAATLWKNGTHFERIKRYWFSTRNEKKRSKSLSLKVLSVFSRYLLIQSSIQRSANHLHSIETSGLQEAGERTVNGQSFSLPNNCFIIFQNEWLFSLFKTYAIWERIQPTPLQFTKNTVKNSLNVFLTKIYKNFEIACSNVTTTADKK